MNEDQNNLEQLPDEVGDINKPLPSFKQFNQRRVESSPALFNLGQRQFRRSSAREYAEMARDEAGEKIKQLVVQKTKQALAQAARSAAIAAWSTITATVGPYAAVLIVCVLLIAITALPALGMWSKARKGIYGNGSGSFASAAASTAESKIAMAELRELFGQNLVISDYPEEFYFSQADPKFNEVDLQGWWNAGKRLKNAGCTLTSITMIMRYYGIKNVTPVDVANYHASGASNKYLGLRGNHSDLFNHFASAAGVSERNAKDFGRKLSFNEIKQIIQTKTPILAGGNKICDSSGEHWIVIIGVAPDGKSVIISDPAGGWRSSPARYCSMDKLNNTSNYIFEAK